MKLNPDDLRVTSFDTSHAQAELAQPTYTTCTIFPTPATQCFVCPAPTSPEDGC